MEYTLQGKTEDDTSSIRLGIFIPKQTDNKEKSKKSKTSSSPVLEGKTHKEKSKTSSSPVLEGKTHKEKSKTSSSPVLEGKTHKEKSKTSSSPVLEGKTHTYSSGRSRKRARVESEKVDGQKEPVMVDLEEISLPNNHNIMHEHKQTKRTDAIQRKRRKRKHKRRVEDNTSQSDKMAGNRDNALQYLRTWQTDLSSWSFRKKIQYWLLKNMFDKTKVSGSSILFFRFPVYCVLYSIIV